MYGVRQYGLHSLLLYLTTVEAVDRSILTAGFYTSTTMSPQEYIYTNVGRLRDWKFLFCSLLELPTKVKRRSLPPSRGLLRDCKTSHNLREPSFEALLATLTTGPALMRRYFANWAAHNSADMDYLTRDQWERGLLEITLAGDWGYYRLVLEKVPSKGS